MERKVIIISNKTQSQHVIENSKANTLGELKKELRSAGIDFEGMSFFEGHARVELKDDASVLPTNIPYKGQIVNDLTFLLSAPEKHIKSGALRSEIFAKIKAKNLQGKVMELYGRNMTQVGTKELEELLENYSKVGAKSKKATSAVKTPVEKTSGLKPDHAFCNVERALVTLMGVLRSSGHLSVDSEAGILAVMRGQDWKKPQGMSQKEINEMFDFVS